MNASRLSRRRYLLLSLAILAVIAAAVGWCVWPRGKLPQHAFPELPPESLDPEVAVAISGAREKIERSPRSLESWSGLGRICLANSLTMQTQALARHADYCFRQCEELDPNDPHWPYYRALANLYLSDDEVMAAMQRAVDRCDRFDPEATCVHLHLATLLIGEGRIDEAAELLRRVRAREPGNTHAIYLSALIQERRNDVSGSIVLFRLVSDHVTARQKVCTKLSQLYLRRGDVNAATHWDQLARQAPEDSPWPDAYALELRSWMLGRKLRLAELNDALRAQRHADVVEMLHKVIENGEMPLGQAYLLLADSLTHLARGPEAINAYREALRHVPDSAETHDKLAQVHLFEGEALERQRGDAAAAKFHYQQALASAQKAVSINPNYANGQWTLGCILLQQGERTQAIAALKACLAIRPEMSRAHLNLGEALAEEGQLTEARQHLLDAVRYGETGDPRPKEALERFEKKFSK